jgi:hypothetical protein
VALACGALVGLAPGAWREAAGLPNFAEEVWFPLAIGAALALTLVPVYVMVARTVARRWLRRAVA